MNLLAFLLTSLLGLLVTVVFMDVWSRGFGVELLRGGAWIGNCACVSGYH